MKSKTECEVIQSTSASGMVGAWRPMHRDPKAGAARFARSILVSTDPEEREKRCGMGWFDGDAVGWTCVTR